MANCSYVAVRFAYIW